MDIHRLSYIIIRQPEVAIQQLIFSVEWRTFTWQKADFTFPVAQGILYCKKLCELERRYREQSYDYKKRYTKRLKDAKPSLEAFLSWIDAQSKSGSSKRNTALTYARNEYSGAIVHAFRKYRAPFSGKAVHTFPERSANVSLVFRWNLYTILCKTCL